MMREPRDSQWIATRILLPLAVLLALGLGIRMLFGGERVQCAGDPTRPVREHWSWRSGIDGRQEKCWFRGQMRPANELFWGVSQSPPRAVEQPGGPIAEDTLSGDVQPSGSASTFDQRWVDPTGWSHKE